MNVVRVMINTRLAAATIFQTAVPSRCHERAIHSRNSVMKKIWPILYFPYRFLFLAPLIGLSTIFFSLLTIVLLQFVSAKTASLIGGCYWARFNSFFTPMLVRVIGRENIDAKQSYVVVSNHQSQYDIFVLYGWLGVDFKWVMKKELRKVPGLGAACEKLGHIFVDRAHHKAALSTLEEARKKIVNGTSVIFFPEGTRSLSGKLGIFKKGAFMTARELGIPILPVTIVGTHSILPPQTLRVMPGRATLVIHEPIPTAGYSNDNITELMSGVKKVIQSGLDRYGVSPEK